MPLKLIYFIISILLFSALIIVSYNFGIWRFHYPDRKDFYAFGLDVSHHQGDIDWSSVPRDLYPYVYIKATEGGDFKDPKFQKNLKQSRQHGFIVGAYHFFTLCKSGLEQANNFQSSVRIDEISLPPVIDLEFSGNCKARPSQDIFLKELDDFAQIIKETYRQDPLIYTTHAFYQEYLKGTRYEKLQYWIRDTITKPEQANFPNWLIWQFADNANIPGILGKVDLNAYSRKP